MDCICTAQLSVEVPLSCVKDTPAVSPRVAVSARTELESLGQPDPEKTRRVILGEAGGAARERVGSRRRKGKSMVNGGAGLFKLLRFL
jgi:hypothetical protein